MPAAIFSVHNKTELTPFMKFLAECDWELYATSGTQKTYLEATGKSIQSLHDALGTVPHPDRERTALRVSDMLRTYNLIDLACINLRPPRLEGTTISLDVGGMAMIGSAGNSGAMVVTNPDSYQEVMSCIRTSKTPSADFRYNLQLQANQHIADHVLQANNLTT